MTPGAVAYLVEAADGKPAVFLDRVRAEQASVQMRGTLCPLFTRPQSDATLALALEIADDAMLFVIRESCTALDEFGVAWIPAREDGEPAERLCHAAKRVRAAVDWLLQRGQLVVSSGPDGDVLTIFEGLQ